MDMRARWLIGAAAIAAAAGLITVALRDHFLQTAVDSGSHFGVSMWLRLGADPNAFIGPMRAVDIAISRGDLECVAQLVSAGADLNNAAPGGELPVACAVGIGYPAVLRLVELGASPRLPVPVWRDVAISARGERALAYGRGDRLHAASILDAIRLLLEHNKPEHLGHNVVIHAAVAGDLEYAEVLVRAGCGQEAEQDNRWRSLAQALLNHDAGQALRVVGLTEDQVSQAMLRQVDSFVYRLGDD